MGISARTHVGPGPSEVRVPESADVLRELGRFRGRPRHIDAPALELGDEALGVQLGEGLRDRGGAPGDPLEVVRRIVLEHVRHQDEHFPSWLVGEELLGHEERAEDVGVRAHVALREHLGDVRPDLLLETEDLGLELLGVAVVLQDVVEPPAELGLGRQGDLDEGTEFGHGLVVNGGDQESVSRRERRQDLALDLPSVRRPVVTRDAPREVDEDDDRRRVSDGGRHGGCTAGRQEKRRRRQDEQPGREPASGLNAHPVPRSRRSRRPPPTASVRGTPGSS